MRYAEHKTKGNRIKPFWEAEFRNLETDQVVSRRQYDDQRALLTWAGYTDAEKITEREPAYVWLGKDEKIVAALTQDGQQLTRYEAKEIIRERYFGTTKKAS